jgi:hypothetical protein
MKSHSLPLKRNPMDVVDRERLAVDEKGIHFLMIVRTVARLYTLTV